VASLLVAGRKNEGMSPVQRSFATSPHDATL
jgi:hypothetical protein